MQLNQIGFGHRLALCRTLSLSLLASVGLGGYFAGSDSHILRPAFVQSESQPNYTGQGIENWEQGTSSTVSPIIKLLPSWRALLIGCCLLLLLLLLLLCVAFLKRWY